MNEKIAISVTVIGAAMAMACGFLPNAHKHTARWLSNRAAGRICSAVALFVPICIVLYVFYSHANGDNLWWALIVVDACYLPFLTPMVAELRLKSRAEVSTKPKMEGGSSR